MAKEYYQILGLTRNASDDDIKKAYRKLALQYHPDRNPGKEEWANEKFKEINEAYSTLGDPNKRKQYDQFGTTGTAGDIFSSPYTRSTFEDLMREFNQQNFGTGFLGKIFGKAFKNGAFSFRVYNNAPGQNLSFEDILRQAQGQPQYQQAPVVNYEIIISKDQAKKGMEKDLVRNQKKLRVKIPAGIKSGTKIRLGNARNITDAQPGDIYITVKVKKK
jgi:DnaJ-class molecular chaperone